MYFPDLSPYSYRKEDIAPNHINIGWLSSKYPFSQGTVSEEFIDKLKEYCEYPYNLMRGFHRCEFCYDCKKISNSTIIPDAMGTGEVWVKSKEGITYIAPIMIYHYIVQHKYLPPSEFINAVLSPLEHPAAEFHKKEEAFLDEMYETLGENEFIKQGIYKLTSRIPSKYLDILKSKNQPSTTGRIQK